MTSATKSNAILAGSNMIKSVWIFDSSRRVYRRDENGRAIGGPVWREHWVGHEIVGETSRSWITEFGRKVPKKGGYGIAFDAAEIDRQEYIHKHRCKIADAVRRCDDYYTLRQIAEMAGYVAE